MCARSIYSTSISQDSGTTHASGRGPHFGRFSYRNDYGQELVN